MFRWFPRNRKVRPARRSQLDLVRCEDRITPALPVLMVIANQDFYYQEYNDTRNSLLADGVPVVIAATTTTPSTPHAGSGQGTGTGVILPTVAIANADASDYSAIVFVGGWGASMYQYAYNDPNLDGVNDNLYFNAAYNGDANLNDGVIAPQKVAVNELINDFLESDKPVAGICHGTTVLAWARVNGVSPVSGKNIVVPHTDGTPAMFFNGTTYSNGFAQGQYLQALANGAKVSAVGGQIGNPTTAADDVIVDGRIITAENQHSAALFGHVIAQQVSLPPTAIQGPTTISIAEGTLGSVATFTSSDPEGGALTWSVNKEAAPHWKIDFTIGPIEAKLIPVAAIDGPATDMVQVIATDTAGKSTGKWIEITSFNVAPTATGLSGPTTLIAGESGTFSLSGVVDVASDLATMKYDFSLPEESIAISYGKASAVNARTVSFAAPGTYTVTGRAYDKDGGISDTKSIAVNVVANQPPTPIQGPTVITVPEGVPGALGQYTSTDPEGGPLTWSLSGPNASLFSISKTGVLSGLAELDGGQFTGGIRVAVADVGGDNAVLDVDVIVQNVAPTVQALNGPTTLIVGEAGTFTPTGVSDIAADQKTMKYIHWKLPAPPIMNYDNAVSTPNATYTFTTPGTHTVFTRAFDKDGGVSETKSFTVNVVAPPTVLDFTVNGGAGQRSRVSTFSQRYADVPPGSFFEQPDAVRFVRSDGTTVANTGELVTFTTTITPDSGGSTVTFTINPAATHPGLEHGSLADGRWRLTIPAWNYESPQFFRLYGDVNGDATVDGATDFPAFGNDFNRSFPNGNSPLDFNGDGVVDGAVDFPRFGVNYNYTL